MIALLLLAAPLLAGAPEGERPRHNTSFVPDDDGAVRQLATAAAQAAEAGNFAIAAERLQALVARGGDGVLAHRERELYLSPRRWAAVRLLSGLPPFGPEVLAAWRAAYDLEACTALRGAILAGDEEGALALADRYPACSLLPALLLALSDRALQRGDAEGALALLDRLPEHVAAGEAEKLAFPSIAARRAHLEARPRPRPAGWPTHGGDFTRSRAGDPLPGGRPEPLWECPLTAEPLLLLEDLLRTEPRPQSPLLPFLPVCDRERVYVHLGTAVAAVDRRSGKLLFFAPDEGGLASEEMEAMLVESPGARAATVDRGVLYFDRVRTSMFADGCHVAGSALTAFDVASRTVLWERRLAAREGTEGAAPLFFRGAPAIDGERLLVCAGARETGETSSRKEESHLLCFDRRDGSLLWRRFLGYGETEAPGSFPPQGGLPVAVARQVAVAVTGIGVAAACDVRTGEILWLFRYDRLRPRERDRLAEAPEHRVAPVSAWFREPPRIVGSRVLFASFDSDSLYCCTLRGERRPGGDYHLVLWDRHRSEGHRACLFEYLGGVGGGRVVCVGRRDRRDAAGENVVSFEAADGTRFAYARLPADLVDEAEERAGPPELHGHPAVAGDVLLVPTVDRIFRFRPFGPPIERREGEISREIEALPPYDAFGSGGSLLAEGGVLYMVGVDRIVALAVPR
jgi:hypothetical protein